MIGALLLLLTAAGAGAAETGPPDAPAALRPGTDRISSRLQDAQIRVNRELSKTEFGRHLLAVTAQARVVEWPAQPGFPVRFVRSEPGWGPLIVVDRDRAAGLSLLEFEVLFLKARWMFASKFPVELSDAEMAAEQAVLEFALEKASADDLFAGRLREATKRVREALEARRKMRDWAVKAGEKSAILFPGPPPKPALDRVAFDACVFSEDPFAFYSSAVETAGLSDQAVTLTELEDFLGLHGRNLDRVSFAASGRVALVEGRPYPGRVARAARAVRDGGGLDRLREGLGLFRAEEMDELKKKVNAWLRSVP